MLNVELKAVHSVGKPCRPSLAYIVNTSFKQKTRKADCWSVKRKKSFVKQQRTEKEKSLREILEPRKLFKIRLKLF